jgi:hypothetical protein
MTTATSLTGAHLRTYRMIFQHPASHNLAWRDVHALFGQLGTLTEEPNGNFKVTRNGKTIVLRPSRQKDVGSTDELMGLRHFIEGSEPQTPNATEVTADSLLVIDHREARIFRLDASGTEPQRILPHKPEDFFRHEHNSKEFTRGMEKPEPNSYFEPVALALRDATRILVFGTGSGMASEMEQFGSWLDLKHPELAKRVIGSVTVDESHMSDGQLLAKAHSIFGDNLNRTA